MAKKNKSLFLSAIIIFLIIIIVFPLPKVITELLWTAKLNDFLPGFIIKTQKTNFYLFRKFQAESVSFIKNGFELFEFKNLKIKHSPFLMFTGRGKFSVTADNLVVKTLPSSFDFLSKILEKSLSERMIFENISVESAIEKNKFVVKWFECCEKNFKVTADGYAEKMGEVDFNIEISLSERFAETMSEDAEKFSIESQEDGISKIKLRIHWLPEKPHLEMETNFLLSSV